MQVYLTPFIIVIITGIIVKTLDQIWYDIYSLWLSKGGFIAILKFIRDLSSVFIENWHQKEIFGIYVYFLKKFRIFFCKKCLQLKTSFN